MSDPNAEVKVLVAKFLEDFARDVDSESSVPMLPKTAESFVGFTHDAEVLTAIIANAYARHHPADEGRGLLEECAAKFAKFRRHADSLNYDDSQGPADEWPIEIAIRKYLGATK